MVLQIDEGGGLATSAGEEVFIDTQHPRTGLVRHLRSSRLAEYLVLTLNRCRADTVRAEDLALCDASIVGFNLFEPESL